MTCLVCEVDPQVQDSSQWNGGLRRTRHHRDCDVYAVFLGLALGAELCWCLAHCLIHPKRKNLRNLHRTTRQLRGVCDRCNRLSQVYSRSVRSGKDSEGLYVPFDDFLPMPSLSTTSSAHCMCLVSAGTARRRSVPETLPVLLEGLLVEAVVTVVVGLELGSLSEAGTTMMSR